MGLRGTEVAVIGAGVGGLAAALALARRGARVRVLEQAPVLREVGAGLQVGPNGIAVLEALGLADAVAPHASVPQAIELRDYRRGRRVARMPLDAGRAGGDRPYWQIHRADLVGELVSGARAAGVDIRLGARVRRVAQRDGGVGLTLEDGAEITAALAVAADGIRSEVRAAHFAGAPPRFTGHVAWRALIAADQEELAGIPPGPCVTMGPGRHLVTYPLRGGRLMNLVAVEERAGWAAEGWMHPDDPEALRRAFAGWNPQVTALLWRVETPYLWGLYDHPPLARWVSGRIVLLGDACHPMLPFLAQGASMALEDAWVLAAALDTAATLEAGLADFAAQRMPRAERVQRAAARNGRLYHLATPGLRRAAHLGLGAVSALAPGALLGRFAWLYGFDVTAGR